MSDGQLSQAEIDALLGHNLQSGEQEKTKPEATPSLKSDDASNVSEFEEDVLGEIGNISFGSAATTLSTILNHKVEITTPKVRIVNRNHLDNEFPVPYVSVLVNYTEGFEGSCVLVIKTHDASVIADLMMGGDGRNPSSQINEMEMSAVQEAMNQMMGSSSTALSAVFNTRIDISPPELTIMDVRAKTGTQYIPKDETMCEVFFRLKIGSLVDSHIMQLIPVPFGKQLVNLLTSENTIDPQGDDQSNRSSANQEELHRQAQSDRETRNNQQRDADPYGIPSSSELEETGAHGVNDNQSARLKSGNFAKHLQDVQPAEFSSFDDVLSRGNEYTGNINMLMDIPLDVSVELGRTKKTIKEVLELGPGSIIELDKLAGEPIDILVNNKSIAKGEVVVVDENFGIRITEILNHYDRIQNMR